MIGRLSAAVDRAATVALSGGSRSPRRSRAASLGPIEREHTLRRLLELYDRSLVDDPEAFFPAPHRVAVDARSVRRLPGGEVLDLCWTSAYEPFVPRVRDRYLAQSANLRAHARLYLHGDRPRPAAIVIHGYLGGRYAIEERVWPIRWLYERGLDVALPVLPFHGPRATRRVPAFPNSDPRVTIEGFRQAVMDLRALVDHLEGRGSETIGAMGMSLGGYTTALMATVEPRLAFAVPFIPLASIADFAREGRRFVGTASQQVLQHRLLDEVHRVVSPFARPVRVPRQGRLVVAGRADRITPAAHAERIARHFEVPVTLFPGGHLLQIGRGQGFRAVGRMLGALGLLEPRPQGARGPGAPAV